MPPYVADSALHFNNWQITFTTSHGNGTLRPLIVLSPIIAETIAKAGWSKLDVKRYIYEHARMPAWKFEQQLRDWNIRGVWDLKDDVTHGRIPKVFYESDDPNRLVLVWKPEDYMRGGSMHHQRQGVKEGAEHAREEEPALANYRVAFLGRHCRSLAL